MVTAGVVDSPELVRVRVLWYSLRAPGFDPPGPPGIDYTRDRVQTSLSCPTTPHGFGTGHAFDPVGARLDALAREHPGPARWLRWFRAYDAAPALTAGSVRAILDAAVRDLAEPYELAGWITSAPTDAGPQRQAAHVAAASRAWARAHLGAAEALWRGA